MASSARTWINKSALAQLSALQHAYQAMASVNVVEEAAMAGAQALSSSMQDMILSQQDLTGYQDISAQITPWKGNDGIFAGLPEGHDLVGRANDMEQTFPLVESIVDLERQTGETQRAFLAALGTLVGLTPQGQART
jgi:hypothetical protein